MKTIGFLSYYISLDIWLFLMNMLIIFLHYFFNSIIHNVLYVGFLDNFISLHISPSMHQRILIQFTRFFKKGISPLNYFTSILDPSYLSFLTFYIFSFIELTISLYTCLVHLCLLVGLIWQFNWIPYASKDISHFWRLVMASLTWVYLIPKSTN